MSYKAKAIGEGSEDTDRPEVGLDMPWRWKTGEMWEEFPARWPSGSSVLS